MRKISIFLITFALLTTIGCRTTQTVETESVRAVKILQRPQRQTIDEIDLNNKKDVLKVLNYYEYLVETWEAWADCVYYLLGISEKMPTAEDCEPFVWGGESRGGIEEYQNSD